MSKNSSGKIVLNNSLIWEVDYWNLKACIASLNWLVVQYWHPAYSHQIIFNFERKPGCGVLTLKSLYDSGITVENGPRVGEDSILACYKIPPMQFTQSMKYIPYPKDLRRVIADTYGIALIEDGYFTYDPVTTLKVFNCKYPNKSMSDKTIIKRKLLADLPLTETLSDTVKEEMLERKLLVKGEDLTSWIEANV
jgi:hypothetical protein